MGYACDSISGDYDLGILHRLHLSTPSITATHDPTYGHAGTRRILAVAQKKETARVEELLRAEPDPDTRHHYVTLIASMHGAETWLRPWVEREPTSSVAQMLWGEFSIEAAMKIRGTGRAHGVPSSAWLPFLERIHVAEAAFLAATKIDPDDPVPWGLSITSSMLADAPVAERLARFEEAIARNPRYSRACWSATYAATKKWGGSHQQMFEVAHRLTNDAPRGSAIPAVVCLAHAERWMYSRWFEAVPDPTPYFPRGSVAEEILLARDLFELTDTPAGYRAANAFALCFYLMKNHERAKAEFVSVGGRHDGESIPWAYSGGTKGYAEAIRVCW